MKSVLIGAQPIGGQCRPRGLCACALPARARGGPTRAPAVATLRAAGARGGGGALPGTARGGQRGENPPAAGAPARTWPRGSGRGQRWPRAPDRCGACTARRARAARPRTGRRARSECAVRGHAGPGTMGSRETRMVRDFRGDTGDPEEIGELLEIKMVRDFRGTHEIKGLMGSRETRRVCDCGCARPEGPLGSQNTQRTEYIEVLEFQGLGGGSHEIEGMGMSLRAPRGLGVSEYLRGQEINGSNKSQGVAGVTWRFIGCRIRGSLGSRWCMGDQELGLERSQDAQGRHSI